MKKTPGALLLAASLTILSACTSGVQQGSGSGAQSMPEGEVTLRLSSFFSDRESEVIDQALDMFEQGHPNIKVEHTDDQERDSQLQSLRGGDSFDVLMFGTSSDVPALCKSGSFVSIEEYMTRDKVTPDLFVDAAMSYTAWEDNHCALPMLSDVYALYYNKSLLGEAGIEPPTTLAELAEAARKLTVKNDDDSLKRIGFMPLLDYGQMNAPTMMVPFNLTWVDDSGKAQLSKDEHWADMLKWQKDLIQFYGAEQLKAFRSSLGDEFSAQHPFYTGQLAMMLDGEWRVAFLENEKPDLDYGVVPMPAQDAADTGGGFIAGTVLGIPSRSKNQAAAWELVKFLSTDEDVLEYMASELKNVPTTVEGLQNKSLRESEQFAALMDIALDENSRSMPPTLAGDALKDLFTQSIGDWQWSDEIDPSAFLEKVNDQIDAQLEQSQR